MQKVIFSFLLAVAILMPVGILNYQVNPASAAPADKAGQEGMSKKEAQELKRRKELEGTEWPITVYSDEARNKNEEKGSISFQNELLTFKDVKSLDLGSIGYTLTAYEDNEKGTWETFLITKEGNISIRADWEGQIMNGIISQQSDGGKTIKARRFTSVNLVRPIVETKKEATADAVTAAPVENNLKALVATESPTSLVATEDSAKTSDKKKKK